METTCLASLTYRPGDHLGQSLAMACKIPYIIALYCIFKCHITRDIHDLLLCIGYGLNAVFSKALKTILAQPRPPEWCASLGTCHSHGMPSTHGQFMAFCAFYALLCYRYRKKHTGSNGASSWIMNTYVLVEHLVLWGMVLAVGVGRVHLGYHSIAQVAVGMALGVVCAQIWYRCVRCLYGNGFVNMVCSASQGLIRNTSTLASSSSAS